MSKNGQDEQEPNKVNVTVEVKEQPINPLLRKIQMPGEKYRLPSLGIFYKDGELADHVKNGEVEIFPMKTIDEINLKTPDMIFQGTAITRVFERCIPDIKKPLKLLSNDVDYLMGCLRKVSYGNFLPIESTCECDEHTEKHTYNVPLHKILVENTVEIDAETIEEEYIYDLHNDKNNETMRIQFRPILFENLVEIYQYKAGHLSTINDDDADEAEFEAELDDFFSMASSSLIQSVDGIDDHELITEWTRALPLPLKMKLAGQVKTQTDWGTSFEYTAKCVNCGKDIDLSPSMNPVYFFTLPSSQIEAD